VWFPISTLYTAYPEALPFLEGDTIDIIGEEQVCWKYELPEKFFPSPNSRPRVSSRSLQVKEMLANGGFELHYDTPQLRYHPNAVRPSDMVEITDKWHGTSIVVGKPLIPRRLSFMEKVKNYLWTRFGWDWALVCTHEYALAWASRRVVKGIEGLYTSSTDHYYGEDLWGQVAHEIAPKIPNGYVVYGEVVGYTLSGKQIQPGYTYGCKPGKHKFAAYRMTRKSFVGGGILELPCGHSGLGLATVPLLKMRIASELLPLLAGETEEEWQVRFHSWLRETFVRDQDCPYNSPGTPSEGIVIRVIPRELWDSGAHFPRSARGYGVYKLKNPRFLLRETENADLGVEGVEG
jgi:hypothetical protein